MKPNPFTGKALWAFDTETWLIQPGLLAPPLVCGSWACAPGSAFLKGTASEILTDKADTRETFRAVLEGGGILVGHNLAYDLGVMCADDPTLVPLVFAKLDRDEAFDTMLAEKLIQIHQGSLGQGFSSSGGGFSLEELGRKYLGSDRKAEKSGPDSYRLRYAELDDVPLDQWPEAAVAYPIRDARETYDVAAAQIRDGRNLHDLPAQVRAHWVLHLSAMWGIRTDAAWVAQFTGKVTAEHTRSRARFLAAGLLKVRRCVKKNGVREPGDAIDKEALLEAIRFARSRNAMLTVGTLTKALADLDLGKPQRYGTDKKALEAVVTDAYQGDPPVSSKGNIRCNKDTLWESGDKLLEEFADAQDNEKFFSTYLKVLAQGTRVPINTRYDPIKETGRTSASSPNLQNLPRGSDEAGRPREGFIAREGMVFASLDYPTLELRTLAFALEYLGFESRMAAMLRQILPNGVVGIDLHAQLAAVIRNGTLEEVMTALESKEKWAKDFRQMAKAGNFGLPGGLGVVKLVTYARQSYDARFCLLSGRATECGTEKHYDKRSRSTVCKTCLEVATEIKAAWFAMLPEMDSEVGYFALVKDWTQRDIVTIETDDGELEDIKVGSVTQIISERVRGRCTFTNGANTIFQGLAADVAKRALWLVARECYTDPTSPLWGSRIVVFVHDELFMELPVATASASAERACRLMEQAFAEFCGPGVSERSAGIPCKVEPALAFRWYKDADTQRDAEGNVVPVEKCETCGKLAPVGWDGVVLKHKTKAGVCAGVGKENQVAVARGFRRLADLS